MIAYNTLLVIVCVLVLFAILMDGLLAWIEADRD